MNSLSLDASVVVATRDRPEGVRDLLRDLAGQVGGRTFELIVVDDGSEPALTADAGHDELAVRVLRLPGVGPARARNVGWTASRAPIVLFTDDDVRLDQRWLDAACLALERDSSAVVVEGRVDTPPFDWLYEYSVAASHAGMGLTCNIAYRRSALDRLAGFDETFPFPHCEDLDLVLRARHLGGVAYSDAMRVVHSPRAMGIRDFARRGRFAASEVALFRRHRERYPRYIPTRLLPLLYWARHWAYVVYKERDRLVREPARGRRWLLASLAQLVAVVRGVATAAPRG